MRDNQSDIEVRGMNFLDFFRIGNIRTEGPNDSPHLSDNIFVFKDNSLHGKIKHVYYKTCLLLKLLTKRSFINLNAILALDNGKPMGVCWTNTEGKSASLGMFVNSKYRGLGIGTRLMDATIDWARKNRFSLNLTVNEDNEAALHIYKKKGFKTVRKIYEMELKNK